MIIDNLTIIGLVITIGVAVIVSRLASKGASEVVHKSRRPQYNHIKSVLRPQ